MRDFFRRLLGAPEPLPDDSPETSVLQFEESDFDLPAGPQPGERWDGYAAVADGLDVDHVRGVYALTDDGRDLRRPLLRLVAVDETPGVSEDGNFHYEIAYPEDGMNKTYDGSRWPYRGEGVILEPEPIVGKAGLE
jgi:hypothetical protein